MKFIIVFTFATIAMAVMGSPHPRLATPNNMGSPVNGNVMSWQDWWEMSDRSLVDWDWERYLSLLLEDYHNLVESQDW